MVKIQVSENTGLGFGKDRGLGENGQSRKIFRGSPFRGLGRSMDGRVREGGGLQNIAILGRWSEFVHVVSSFFLTSYKVTTT